MPYIYSTLSQNQKYQNWKRVETVNEVRHEPIGDGVIIAGGFGVANKRTFLVANGAAATMVTDEQLAYLNENPTFIQHLKEGFLAIDKKKKDGEKAASSDMNIDDKSQQLSQTKLESNRAAKLLTEEV